MFTHSEPGPLDALTLISMRLKSLSFIVFMVILAACGGKKGSGGSSHGGASNPLPEVTNPGQSKEPQTPAKAPTSWCALDSQKGRVFTTTRITFGEKRATVEYIRTGEEMEPALYVKSDDVMYELKSESAEISDRFVVENVTNEADVQHLENFDEQRYQLEKVLSTHEGMKVSGYFTPKRAIIVETRIVLPQRKTILYPCADFTKSLDEVENKRPLIELDIELGFADLTHSGTYGPLARELNLKLPIEHVKPDFSKLAGKQFCAWNEFRLNSASVEVLSIGKNFFRMNSYTDYKINPDLATDRQDMEKNAKSTWTYIATSMNEVLAGRAERTYSSGEIISFEREFNLVKDANGRSALIRKNKTVLPTDIYRECSETKATDIYQKFRKALPFILNLELTQAL